MKKNLILGVVISLFSMQTFATSFGVFDPRSLAMGGTGVASGDASNASHYNPALLSLTHEDDDFSLVIPTITAGYSDPDNLQDAFDAYDNANYEAALDSSITAFNTSTTVTEYKSNATNTATATQNLKTGINTLSNKALVLNASAGVLLAIPSKKVAVSIYASGRAVGGAVLNISDADNTLINEYITVLNCIGSDATTTVDDIKACDTASDLINDTTGDFNTTNIANDLTSTIAIRGAVITEAGISLAHKFASLAGTALGITPKAITVNTFDISRGVETSSNLDIDDSRKDYTDVNFDLGMANKLTETVKVGLVAKNVLSKEYKTVLNNTVKLEPQLRAGIAYQNDWVLLAADADLTKNEGFGFENDTQNIAVGAEFDLYDTFQLRAGYVHNLENKTNADDGSPSVGIGLSPFGIHLDLAVATNSAGLQAGVQLGFKF